MKVKMLVIQLCWTLADPMNCSPPDSPIHGILQTKILEWVAIPFFRFLPNLKIKLGSSPLQADSLPSEPLGTSPTTFPEKYVYVKSLL